MLDPNKPCIKVIVYFLRGESRVHCGHEWIGRVGCRRCARHNPREGGARTRPIPIAPWPSGLLHSLRRSASSDAFDGDPRIIWGYRAHAHITIVNFDTKCKILPLILALLTKNIVYCTDALDKFQSINIDEISDVDIDIARLHFIPFYQDHCKKDSDQWQDIADKFENHTRNLK